MDGKLNPQQILVFDYNFNFIILVFTSPLLATALKNYRESSCTVLKRGLVP